MKLLSGHEICELNAEEIEKQKDFKAYGEIGLITLQPGNWFFLKSYAKHADRIYQFPFKSEDTLIMTYPKCGTTWTQEIVWTIIYNPDLNNPMSKLSIHARSPFLEFDFLSENPYVHKFMDASYLIPLMKEFQMICPGKDPRDGVVIQMAEAMQGERIIKTHNPLSLFDPKLIDTCKVVYVVRHPKDVCISYLHHSRLIRGHDYQGSLESFVDLFINDSLLWSPYWTSVKEAWNKRSHPNLHFMYYEDLKANPSQQIGLLAKFLAKDLTDEQIQNVVNHTSFSSMKNRADELDLFPKGTKNTEIADADGGFFRKGESGDGKKKLAPELEDKIDAWIKTNTRDMDGDFKYKPNVSVPQKYHHGMMHL